ncbi:apolipoprotein N-acyltransferase [Sneathiella limimaris]|uniref:apolipoprotein N-acyltransferase n=1 Tax=Sneathiella limimaris TaxID=1964213 RepID=UPI00146C2DDF|nr:apolipoprotein N-acyltransferase [Sneathiella limimaris]
MKNFFFSLSDVPFWKKAFAAFFLGALLAATLAPVHAIFFLPVCFSGLLLLVSNITTRWQAFFTGWWFGWGFHIAGLYWIGVAFTIDADTYAALLPIPILVLPACLAIFTGLTTLIIHLLGGRGILRILAFAGIWTGLEYIRGILFTGFPWNLIGYAWGDMLAMLQWTAFVGIYGLTFLTVLISSIPVILGDTTYSKNNRHFWILADCCLIILLVGVGFWRLNAPDLEKFDDMKVKVLQPGNEQKDKWKSGTRFQHVKRLEDLSRQNPSDANLLIWPETAVPFFLTTDERIRNYLTRNVPKNGYLITGAPRRHPIERKYWNSVQALNAQGKIEGIYDKRHLLPYGEYLPLRSFLKSSGLASLIPVLDQMSDFSFPDADASDVMAIPGVAPFRVLICYEVTFPWEVKVDTKFDWILNVTNDAWFGHTSGPYQHFVISRTRAIEQGVSIVRSANKGITAVIDGYGRILKKRSPLEAGAIESSVPAPLSNRTLYFKAGEIIPLSICLFSLLPFLIVRLLRRE